MQVLDTPPQTCAYYTENGGAENVVPSQNFGELRKTGPEMQDRTTLRFSIHVKLSYRIVLSRNNTMQSNVTQNKSPALMDYKIVTNLYFRKKLKPMKRAVRQTMTKL